MLLEVAARVGPYEILSALGAGGMGEVYRAHDTKLGRDVAIKILPQAFLADPERVARFQREARTLASLNHPNIGGIYGLEEAAGMAALVLELVEGPTLADRIAQGPISIEEALPIAKQIAEALETAHAQGIIHRDLKPANIKVRPDGTVKVLDFGLAKALDPVGHAPNLSQSPTITTPAMMTAVGVILGTAAYMSPEQARGKTVDKRADIWAFGAVLFEMLTGKRAFDGDDVSDTLAAVLRAEPDWNALPAEAAFPVRTLLRGCLEKDPRQRIADISAALFVLRHQATGAAIDGPAQAGRYVRGNVRRVAVFTTAALILGAAVAGTGVWFVTRPAPPAVVRTTISAPGSTALTLSGVDRDVAITPDGSRVVYRGDNQLLVRALNQLQPLVVSGLGAPHGIFVSPDGLWVGFFDGFSLLKRVAITGGPPETVSGTGQGAPSGATWGPDGTIIFATNSPATGLQRVPAAGGEPTVLTKPNRERGEGFHLWPEFLPSGKAVLFTIIPTTGGIDNAQVAVLDLRTGTSRIVIRGGSHAHYVPTGHLVYGVSGTLRAVAFDLKRLEVRGTPVPVLEGVVTTFGGATDVALAANGSLVYVPGGAGGGGRQTVVSVDRQGRPSPLPGLPLDAYRTVRVSPDGTRLALGTQDDVWVYDFSRATLSRLTTHPAHDMGPLWTPDGQRIVFTSTRAGYPELFWRQADGTGSDERLLTRAKDLLDLVATGWSADGRQLLFSEVPPSIQCAIGQITVARPSDVKLLVKSEANNCGAAVSPDGRWMAYNSDVSGRVEIYIERYPELGNRQLISTGGGGLPLWSRDGRELFFSTLDGRTMFAVPVQSGTTLVAGRPQVLFEFATLAWGGGTRSYDIAPDGRFLIIRSGQQEAGIGTQPQIVVVQNWTEELKRLVPVN
jgi:serine/threonine-protein kinase